MFYKSYELNQFQPISRSKKRIRIIEAGKQRSTKKVVSRVCVLQRDTMTTKTSTNKMPKVSELYSQVSSAEENIISKKVPRQKVLFMQAAP